MKFDAIGQSIAINTASRSVLFQQSRERLVSGQGFALATLNLDHLTKLPEDNAFAAAYAAQDLVVADGRPVVWLSRLARQMVELMPGSDLILPLCRLAAELDLPVALIGSNDAVLSGAGKALSDQVPDLHINFNKAPPYGFDPEGAEAEALLNDLAASGARLCFLALSAPKQEIFAARGRRLAPQVGFVSIGAGLDFLAGQQVRAPRIMRKLALEWLWRLLCDPRRMAPRYARCFAILPGLTRQAWRQRRSV